MTTTVKIHVGGNYVTEVKINGTDGGKVGPNAEKSFSLPHNSGGASTFELTERTATGEEIEIAEGLALLAKQRAADEAKAAAKADKT